MPSWFTQKTSYPHTNTLTLKINTMVLFIVPSHDRKHIVSHLLGLVACSACIIASCWVEAAVQALWMNWVSARGWEMALIPLWCHSRDEGKRGSFMRPPIHSSASPFLPVFLFPLLPHSPAVLLSSYGLILQAGDSSFHPSPTRDALLAVFPSPAQPYPAQPFRLWT